MAVCFFNSNHDISYKCEYSEKNGYMEVAIEYDIENEREAHEGEIILDDNTNLKKRDIIIVDFQNKSNYLLKNAGYAGQKCVYGTPDGGIKSIFRTETYFKHSKYEKLIELQSMPKVNKIKIYSKAVNQLIRFSNLRTEETDEEYLIRLSKKKPDNIVEMNVNGIKNIIAGNECIRQRDFKNHTFFIKCNGYIELELTRRIDYIDARQFINELIIFMQLYFPDGFKIEKVHVMVNKIYYELVMPTMEINYKDKHIEPSVKCDLLDYLKKCYKVIPYRKSKEEIRNIPYIVVNTSRNLEDNFLMFYRFIECYYKKHGVKNSFISNSIKEHYIKKNILTEEQIEMYSQEIISLRNHYVHAGYYIRNSSLRITFDKLDGKKNPKNYTATNVNVHGIYSRTKILYDIVLDIIFTKMLGYGDYKFSKSF